MERMERSRTGTSRALNLDLTRDRGRFVRSYHLML